MTRDEAITTLEKIRTLLTVYPKRKKQKKAVHEIDTAIGMAIEALSAEPRTGEWIHDGQNFKGGIDWCHCSECGDMTSANGLSTSRYCKNCGAKMTPYKGGEDE